MHDENHKMITSSREDAASTKQGVTETTDDKVTISSRLWTSLKNPRIVRVSRSFGGKDRHSKVTTVRGLRDRRVRLSVPTAIQLYDLQDKLGLNQPSKVVDWLLNAAQHEIDKLPPLEIPPGNLMHFPHESMPVIFDRIASPKASLSHKVENANGYLHDMNKGGHQDNASSSSFNTNLADDMTMYPKSMHWGSDHDLIRMKEKEALNEEPKNSHDKGSNSKGNEVGNHEGVGMMNNIVMPFNSYYQLEPSTAAYLSYMRSTHSLSSPEMHHGYHPISMFTPCMTAATSSLDAKQYSYFQLASFPSENVSSNRPRGNYLQSGNSSMMRAMQPNDHNSKVQLPEDHHQK